MKLISFNLWMTIILLVCERKNFAFSKTSNIDKFNKEFVPNSNKNYTYTTGQSQIIKSFKNLEVNMTDLFNDMISVNNSKRRESEDNLKTGINKKFLIKNKNQTISLTNSNIFEKTPSLYDEIKSSKTRDVKTEPETLEASINNLRNFHLSLEEKIKKFEQNKKEEIPLAQILKRNSDQSELNKKKYNKDLNDDNTFMFYNSLSLIMLSMLAGGLLGVMFILYFSFKDNGSVNN